MSGRPRPVEGKLLSPAIKIMLLLWGLGTVAAIYRFTHGLGAATSLNDGYPWGIWIAFDVVVGTGLASGGYAMALLVYVLNKGRYHPLVRPALVTSFLGYSVAGIAVAFDLGRFWNLWKVPLAPWSWNGTSILLEVALCMLAYTAVLLVEISPALLERWSADRRPALADFSRRWLPRLDRALPFVIALGLVLPTMHQSSLGSLLLVAGTKIHPLWHTALLPLLFLLTAFAMGYAIIYFEAIFSAAAFRRRMETRMLSRLGVFVAGLILAFLAIRFSGLFAADRLGLTVSSGVRSFFFWAETLLLGAAALLFMHQGVRASASGQLQAALLALAGGALYRVDAFLVAYRPGQGWVYFPSFFELLVTVGLVATETVAYVWLVRKFPILAGVTEPEPVRVPAVPALQGGATS
jgi:Ni/Fe-hydrogenase subunit HybB-like protein